MQMIGRRAVLTALAGLCAGRPIPAAVARIRRWNPAKPTPALDLKSVEGVRWSLQSLRGRVGVLNFWASWCEPCLVEMTQLNRLARRHERDDRLVVLGINYQEGEAGIRRFSQALSLGFPLLRDPDGVAFRAWGAELLPSTVLVSRSARASVAVEGQLDWDGVQAAQLLQSLLADDSSHASG